MFNLDVKQILNQDSLNLNILYQYILFLDERIEY